MEQEESEKQAGVEFEQAQEVPYRVSDTDDHPTEYTINFLPWQSCTIQSIALINKGNDLMVMFFLHKSQVLATNSFIPLMGRWSMWVKTHLFKGVLEILDKSLCQNKMSPGIEDTKMKNHSADWLHILWQPYIYGKDKCVSMPLDSSLNMLGLAFFLSF